MTEETIKAQDLPDTQVIVTVAVLYPRSHQFSLSHTQEGIFQVCPRSE